ncbi:hypothetical protein [Fodinicurvata fenggangensis]|uniref:hypothetical protein n=1 Tax=Fodinicurvata fenggangensis TaxID=1121830 RepID=UPI0012DD1223|nr:hypothetical protein [Fodinicurvata fenggangensis]
MSVSNGETAPVLGQASNPRSMAQVFKQEPVPAKEHKEAPLQINPVLQYDMKAKVVLFQIVDPASGEIEQQYPSEKQVEAYRKALEEQKDALPEMTIPEDVGFDQAGGLDLGSEAGGASAPAVNGGPDVDPGHATREVSLVA